ncbi:hypothetical protein [Streptomyces viridochromogenes]|uniref:hypothetical protein n=1 Tax=Streptomyces viridochromogenes TaxID=1938 RepID=UPI00133179AA|nr:hypothetical protein [Streptomyces viridochromogenes]
MGEIWEKILVGFSQGMTAEAVVSATAEGTRTCAFANPAPWLTKNTMPSRLNGR